MLFIKIINTISEKKLIVETIEKIVIYLFNNEILLLKNIIYIFSFTINFISVKRL